MTKKAINKHGLKMHGLKKASGMTKDLRGYYSGHYIQLSYDLDTGNILTDYHYNLGENWWTKYHNPNIITVCNLTEPTTMQDIADLISDAIFKLKN